MPPSRGWIARLPVAEPIALAALAIDAAFGWPRALYARIGHPVGLFARVIAVVEARWNRPDRSDVARRAAGVALMVAMIAGVGVVTLASEYGLRVWLGGWAWLGIALAAAPGLAQRSLHDHVMPVAARLRDGDGDGARDAVAMIVGRDTAALDDAGVARAAIESLAESFCDGVVAPFFWLLLFGLPGVWIYKAVNTADSLIGHREERWRAFGWCAARTDDAMNLLPARVAGLLICVAGGRGWRTLWRDHAAHASPNAGWPEAAMAGALDLRLAGPVAYDGVVHDKPWIGSGRTAARADDVARALGLYRRACLLLWAVAGGVLWLA